MLISPNFYYSVKYSLEYCSREEKWKFSNVRQPKVHPSPPQAAQRAPIPEEGIKRANVGAWVHASLLCKQILYPGREIDLTNPPSLPPIAFADNTHHPTPPLPFSLLPRPFLSLSIEPSRRNDVIYPAYLMKPA